MADVTRPRRVLIEDDRSDGKFLRATWHPERRVFVVSTWDRNVCVGATHVGAQGAADLVRLLADGLADAAELGPAPAGSAEAGRTTWRSRLRSWWSQRGAVPLPRVTWGTAADRDTARRSA